ncbi:hypothetical protein MMO38_12240 [Acinetobacter sp. NIPH 1852]|uniref:hypothetical protein n=1 Tax=Acinetobacter sp. NIPH 1852 TaxID=2923428 RepID=UPI001B480E67|nr:hypothetical protein [Acinetobacter sp. NIPH 1852]MBP7879983.1 hypothetical protein [Acinetobacter sp.]MCH7308891.1 hypothetical protein [Acinetobacter sp. NIPH 1852]
MKNLAIKAIFSATVLVTAFAFVGCDQVPQENHQVAEPNTEFDSNISTDDANTTTPQDIQKLSSGNLFNMVRDVAQLQLKTDDYTTLLKSSQNQLEQAIQEKNTQQLQNATTDLKQNLHALHDTLQALQLKSHEVDQIRQSLLNANQQLLKMPILHGQLDISQLDLEKIEQQFNRIQMDMLKLATLILGKTDTETQTDI